MRSFNLYPSQTCHLLRPERFQQLFTLNQTLIARGQGCSYGDACLNENSYILLTERLNCFIEFDHQQGILTAEAGVTLAEILDLIVPHGWFLPVTPGTQYVSLGGCVAADVHGKNHHRVGAFNCAIRWLELITATGQTMRCSAQENESIFWATVGGMGLTGIIATVSLQLMPMTSQYMQVTHKHPKNLDQTLHYLTDENLDDHYSIAWIDALNNNMRSIVMTAHHADTKKPPKKQFQLSIPIKSPIKLLNKPLVKLLNNFYYKKNKKTNSMLVHYKKYFYPLDNMRNWNLLYGKRGFIQYQCVLPLSSAATAIAQIFIQLRKTSYPVFLATLKRLGVQSNGLLSFPMPGFTLALDIPINNQGLFVVLDKLDEIVASQGGRVYLAKDARLKPAMFRTMYPRYQEFLTVKNNMDPQHKFNSSLARRLQIT